MSSGNTGERTTARTERGDMRELEAPTLTTQIQTLNQQHGLADADLMCGKRSRSSEPRRLMASVVAYPRNPRARLEGDLRHSRPDGGESYYSLCGNSRFRSGSVTSKQKHSFEEQVVERVFSDSSARPQVICSPPVGSFERGGG